ncbi:hypothetical protein P879_11451 [Paragonimus westermani]|uniref:Tetraspanin n=1 Tax=Paragonimus westermani TaxID=34504 RepID=A0A8T0DI28_9TREM|nr:hypothetical protein P879_11451 [Paragonimus westermani]
MVKLSCGYKCLQCMLIVFNAVVIGCGIALIVVGSIAEVNLKKYSGTDDAYLHGFVIFVIAFGCFLTVLGIFGFCGACRKSVYCLTMYVIFLVILILAGLAAGIAGFVLKDKVKQYAKDVLTQAYNKYTAGAEYKNLINSIQKDLHCCGPDGQWPTTLGAMPDSCTNPDTKTPYTEGCVDATEQFLKKNILAVALCVFFFALLQVLCMVFAICVIQAIKRGEDA